MNSKLHWDDIYKTKAPGQVSWYQEHPTLSLQLIQDTLTEKTGRIIDVGGGTSSLVDGLLANGFRDVTVLDISATALLAAQQRLGPRAGDVMWMEADITQAELQPQAYSIWHDRAVFHFLTRPEDRQRYVALARRAVRPGGHVIMATFAADGPTNCSGLDTMRYDAASLCREFGDGFQLVDSVHETHHTPFGTEQSFIYCRLCRVA